MADYSLTWTQDLSSTLSIWRELLHVRESKDPLRQPEVVAKWYECLLESNEPCIFLVWHGKQCIGIYPLIVTRKYGLKVLQGLANISFYISWPIVHPKYEKDFFNIFLTMLFKGTFRWNFFRVDRIYTFDQRRHALEEAILSLKPRHSVRAETTYCAPLDRGADWYQNSFLSRNVRRDFRKKHNRLTKLDDFGLEFLLNEDALTKLDHFVEIEDSGWKGQQGTSLKKASSYLSFFRTFCKTCSDLGTLCVALVRAEGKYIAGGVMSIEGDVCHFYRAAYLEEYGYYSPSNELLVELVSYLCQNHPGVRLLNSLPYSYGYKHKFHHSEESSLRYTLANKNLLSSACHGLLELKHWWSARKTATETES